MIDSTYTYIDTSFQIIITDLFKVVNNYENVWFYRK